MAEPEVKDLQQSNTTPGAMLRRQRQRMGWTVDEIANALCLSTELIKSLEANNFAGMGGSTFVLGYLRGYSRLIGIDIEDSIKQHRADIPEYSPDEDNVPTLGNKKKRKSNRKRSKLDMILLASGLAVLIIASGVYLFYGEIVDTLQGTENDNPVQKLASRASSKSDERSTGSLAHSQDAAAELERELIKELVSRIKKGQELPLDLTYRDVGADTQNTTSTSLPASDELSNHLVLIFDEGSWADVRDSRGERLLSQTVVKGSNVDLLGEPPFTVFLGNATGVRVKYQGRIESYSQTKKGLFARFVVGEKNAENE